jgi:hypothetical protein
MHSRLVHAIILDCKGAEHPVLQGGLLALQKFSTAIEVTDIECDAPINVKTALTSEKTQKLHTALPQPLGYGCPQQ